MFERDYLRRRRGRVAAAALALPAAVLVLGCAGEGSGHSPMRPSQAAPTAPVSIQLGRSLQVFRGWGAGVTTEVRVDPLADRDGVRDRRRLERLVFRTGGINLLRVWSPAFGFGSGSGEPEVSALDGRFALMRRARRYGVRFMLTGSDAAPSMKSGTALVPGNEQTYARSLADVLTLAARAGTPFSYVAVGNEVDNARIPLMMSAAQTDAVYADLARLIRARRLKTRLVLGDNSGWPQSLAYVQTQLAARGVRPLVRAIASHAYAGTEGDRAAFLSLGRRERLPVWMTEWTRACPTGDCGDDLSIGFALRRFERIPADLIKGRVSTWFIFRPVSDTSHGPDDGLIVRDLDNPARPYYSTKRFQVFRQFSSAGRPGSRVLAVEGAGHALPAVGFARGGRRALVVMNAQPVPVEVNVDLGRLRGRLSERRTSATENFVAQGERAYRGRPVVATLPGESVTTYYLDIRRRRG